MQAFVDILPALITAVGGAAARIIVAVRARKRAEKDEPGDAPNDQD
ncbi:hypothetical protein AB0L41_31860 [Amycolatopsis mediterranei]